MRCCPVCYKKVKLAASGTCQSGGTLKIDYKIICPKCGLGFHRTGSVVMSYDTETMKPVVDDSDLKHFIKEWDSILRDHEIERIADL